MKRKGKQGKPEKNQSLQVFLTRQVWWTFWILFDWSLGQPSWSCPRGGREKAVASIAGKSHLVSTLFLILLGCQSHCSIWPGINLFGQFFPSFIPMGVENTEDAVVCKLQTETSMVIFYLCFSTWFRITKYLIRHMQNKWKS